MKKFIDYCLSHPVSIDMFILIIILTGIVSLLNLNVEILPVFDVPLVSVSVKAGDVSVFELEERVTGVLERELSTLSGLKHIRSSTFSNQVFIQMELEWGIDKNELLFNISTRIDKAKSDMPAYAEKPDISLADPSARPLAVYAVKTAEPRENFNSVFESGIKQLFLQNKDIANFVYYGNFIDEFIIALDNEKLNALGIDYSVVMNAVRNSMESHNISSYILHEDSRYSIRIDPAVKDINGLENLHIDTGNRVFVRLADIADFSYREQKNLGDIYLDGQEIILCRIYNRYGSNPVSIIQDIDKRVEKWNQSNAISIAKLEDNSSLVAESISDIMINALIGGLAAFLVLFLFFSEIKYPLILMLSMPLSILIAFLFFYLGGISLNIISIGGLSIGIGLLVDNSVIVLESILRNKEDRIGAVHDVFYPVLAGTATTIVVFFPVIYLRGLIGTFFMQQALAITIALLASLLVAFFIVPSMLSRKHRPPSLNIPHYTELEKRSILTYTCNYILVFIKYFFILLIFLVKALFYYLFTGIFRAVDMLFRPFAIRMKAFWEKVEVYYKKSLEYLIYRKNMVLFIFLLFFIFNIYFLFNIDRAFIPEIPSDIIVIEIALPPQTPMKYNKYLCTRIKEAIGDKEGIKNIETHIGQQWTNSYGSRFNSYSSYIKLYLSDDYAKDIKKQESLIAFLAEALDEKSVSSISIRGVETIYGDIFSFGQYPFEINLYKDDMEDLNRNAEKLCSKLKQSGYFSDISSDALIDASLLRISLNEGMIKTHNLSINEIINSLKAMLSAENIDANLKADGISIAISLGRGGIYINELKDKYIIIGGKKFQIRELLSFNTESEPLEIQHRQAQRSSLILARNHTKYNYRHVLNNLSAMLSDFSEKHALLYDITGENARIREAFGDLVLSVFLAVILVYISLGIMLESYRMPVLIMTAIPMGLTGVFTGLFLLGKSLNVFSILGIVVLVGICVNDSILKIAKAQRLLKMGHDAKSAIITASIHKWRPIIITSSTTILGLFPLLFSQGKFAVLAESLALTIILGLTFSTILTLYIIPLLYLFIKRK